MAGTKLCARKHPAVGTLYRRMVTQEHALSCARASRAAHRASARIDARVRGVEYRRISGLTRGKSAPLALSFSSLLFPEDGAEQPAGDGVRFVRNLARAGAGISKAAGSGIIMAWEDGAGLGGRACAR